jgi:hypothetical protein
MEGMLYEKVDSLHIVIVFVMWNDRMQEGRKIHYSR